MSSVSVRMYNVGFGDAFLITFPGDSGPRRVLIDCGVHQKDPDRARITQVAQRIIADCTDAHGTARIDVVIATHRHRDHIAGFDLPDWAAVQVGEVWLPWTEDPDDAEANRLREVQDRIASQLEALAETHSLSPAAEALMLNSITNAGAMKTLHNGFASGRPRPRFLAVKPEGTWSFEPAVLPGVTVHVLGPSRDKETIISMDPPDEETFKHLALSGQEQDGAAPPFRDGWGLDAAELQRRYPDPPRRYPDAPTDDTPDTRFTPLVLDDDDVKRIEALADAAEAGLAMAEWLENALNNTSLMLMFELGDAYLLFPGDAQWGTWRRAMADLKGKQLLKKTTFLKVGHHGSHNATPKSFLRELLGNDVRALVSTRRGTEVDQKWTHLPLEEIFTELQANGRRLVRSDHPMDPLPAGYNKAPAGADVWVEAVVPV